MKIVCCMMQTLMIRTFVATNDNAIGFLWAAAGSVYRHMKQNIEVII